MEGLTGLSHLFVTMFLAGFGGIIVMPAITDVTMAALCPGQDECSLAIYLTGFQHAVSSFISFLSSYNMAFHFQFSVLNMKQTSLN
jgi:hypothetical protein